MDFEDLKALYERKRQQFGEQTYRRVSKLLTEAKELHKRDWEKNPTERGDHEQSWRAFKGKNLEKLVQYMIASEVADLGLRVVSGNILERTTSLSRELSLVKRNVAVNYGELGMHLPDVDIVIYEPNTLRVVAVVSSKVTLRERIAQTSYWKLKLAADEVTRHIRVYFVTPDEDGTLTARRPVKKGRAIVEVHTDGAYVMSEVAIEESDKVKTFDKFIEDLKRLVARGTRA